MELKSNLAFSSLFKPLLLHVSEDTVVIFEQFVGLLIILFVFSLKHKYCRFPNKESLTIFDNLWLLIASRQLVLSVEYLGVVWTRLY